jgi:hypothetical protein
VSPYAKGESTVQYSGSVSAVRTALSTLYFLPAEDVYDAVELKIAVTDAQQLGQTASSHISVESVNDPPVVVLRSRVVQTAEDTPVRLPGVQLIDPDLSTDDVLQVVIEVTQGTVDLNVTRLADTIVVNSVANKVQLLEGAARGNTRLVIVGLVQDLNSVLADALTYVPLPDMNLNWGDELGAGTVRFTVREFDVQTNAVVDEAAAAAHPYSTAVLTVHVTPVNDPSILYAPAVLETSEDTPLRLTNISVTDSDWHEVPGAVLRANVSAMFGTLSIDADIMHRLGRYRDPVTGGTSPSLQTSRDSAERGDAYNSQLTLWARNLEDLNQLLESITYTPPANRNGEDYLQVTAGDSTDPSAVAVAYVTIQLTPVNDAPTITAPAHIIAVEDSVYSIGSVQVHDIDFVTNPVQSALLTVTVSSERGSIKLSGRPFLKKRAKDLSSLHCLRVTCCIRS